jgi:signal transduction histidine kinase
VCVAFAVITFLLVLDRSDATAKLKPEEIWSFLLQITAVFTFVSAVVFVLLSIAISHRFLGPALVIRRAVQAMIDGWYDRRVKLRRRDYLKPLAKKVEELADTLAERETEQKQVIADLHRCLNTGEIDAARALLERLEDKPAKSKRPQPVPVPETVAP